MMLLLSSHSLPSVESLFQGYVYTGAPGSGHFVKLVHNGIEFGMLQAIGEGVELLHNGGNGFNLDLAAMFKNWSNGSVIRWW
jgi:6-phosphogluconate dehydrogenase